MEKEAKLQSRVTVICMLSLRWVLAGKLSRPRLSEAPAAKGSAEQPRPQLQLPGCPARPGPAAESPLCKSWNPTLGPSPTRDHRPQQSPRLRARTRNHRTENISPRPPVAIQHHDHSFPTVAPGSPHPALRPPGAGSAALSGSPPGSFHPPRCPAARGPPPAPTETCCCAGAAIRKRAPRPSPGQSPARPRERGSTRGFREGRCTPQARSAPASGPEGLEPPGSGTPGHSRPPVGLQAERSPCGPAPGNRDPQSPADPGPSTR